MIKEKIRADAKKKLTLLGYYDNTKEEINDMWRLVGRCGKCKTELVEKL